MLGLSPEELSAYSDIAGKLTATVLLALAVIGFLRGWIVPGFIYKAAKAENEKLVGLLDAATSLAEKQTDQADRVLDVAEQLVKARP